MASLELIVNGIYVLEKNGFKYHEYDKDPRDVEYYFNSELYTITVDPWFDVYLERNDADFIRIKIEIDCEHDLQELIAFCEGGYD